MAYIGKDPAQIKRALNEKDTFTGDGSTVVFDLTSDAISANEIQVFVDNIRQEPGASDAYTLGEDGSGNLRRITFTAAPDNGAEIYVINPKTTDTQINSVSDNAITEAKIATGAVTSAKILDGTIVNADINACAAITDTKLAQITTASKVATSSIAAPGSSSVYLKGDGNWGAICTAQQDTNAFNISLLGFKMAVNDGLTVFNLIDGVVDEFNDESGTDESEGSNDIYVADCDYYHNVTLTPAGFSAGFTRTTVTEPDTSTAGTLVTSGPGGPYSGATAGTFTVPGGGLEVNAYLWGAGGTRGGYQSFNPGGGGGFVSGKIAVTPGQQINVHVAQGSDGPPAPQGAYLAWGSHPERPGSNVGGGGASYSFGGGLSGISNNCANTGTYQQGAPFIPAVYMIAGGGGGGSSHGPGGAAGGLTGDAGETQTEQTSSSGGSGGGGSQTTGGQTQPSGPPSAQAGGLFYGGKGGCAGGGGAGYYGGAGGGIQPGRNPAHSGGGGGSSYYGHPQITCGATEEGGAGQGGGTLSPYYVACTNEGGTTPGSDPVQRGPSEPGYILLLGNYCISTPGASTTLVSTAFTSTSVPTTARIVVFEENVDTPTLNTDIIASISRDGGSTYTNATLSDSGYVTGSSGQRILTGQATISGQPSGQSMRWKLALANNTVKIHGVSLQWS